MRVQKIFMKELLRVVPTAVEPRQSLLWGKIYLGRTEVQRKMFFWDYEKLVNPHVCMFGMSGQGKSTTVMKFLREARKRFGANAVIIDFSGEYSEEAEHDIALGRKDCINIMDLGKLTPQDKVEQILHAFEAAFNLNPAEAPTQFLLLAGFLEEAYRRKGFSLVEYQGDKEPPTLLDVYEIAKERYEEEKGKFKHSDGKVPSLESLLLKIKYYANHSSGAFSRQSTVRLDDITSSGIVNLNLKYLPDDRARIFTGMTILNYLLDIMRREKITRGIKLIIVLDEAHRLAGENSPVVPLVKEGRKFGFMVVVSTQDVGDVDSRIIANAGSLFIFRLQSAEAVETIAQSTGLSKYFVDRIPSLRRGQCLVRLNFTQERAGFFVLNVEKESSEKVELILPEAEVPEVR